jgi:nucleotide-binding universal stress UspA family protein
VVQVFPVPPELGYLPPELPTNQQDLLESARAELERLCSGAMAPNSRWQVSVRAGMAWQEITTAAQEIDADLIIIPTQGHTGLQHVMLGRVAERVVRHASCPVLVVRERECDFVQPRADLVQARPMG